MSEMNWKKPVICIFKERAKDDWQSDPFVVLKAKEVTLIQQESPKFSGKIEEFFTLMGDTDYLSSPEGKADHYVLCWFDDTEPDMTKELSFTTALHFKLPEPEQCKSSFLITPSLMEIFPEPEASTVKLP